LDLLAAHLSVEFPGGYDEWPKDQSDESSLRGRGE